MCVILEKVPPLERGQSSCNTPQHSKILGPTFKATVHVKIYFFFSFTHPHVILSRYHFLSFIKYLTAVSQGKIISESVHLKVIVELQKIDAYYRISELFRT